MATSLFAALLSVFVLPGWDSWCGPSWKSFEPTKLLGMRQEWFSWCGCQEFSSCLSSAPYFSSPWLGPSYRPYRRSSPRKVQSVRWRSAWLTSFPFTKAFEGDTCSPARKF
jgi:hypothetical protein